MLIKFIFHCLGLVLILCFASQSLWLALLICTALLAIREFFQVAVSLRRYLLSPENWIELTTILCICVILFMPDTGSRPEYAEESKMLKRHLSAIAIVLSWAELITLVGKHPKLSRFVCLFFIKKISKIKYLRTLRSRIEENARLLIFRKFSTLPDVICFSLPVY